MRARRHGRRARDLVWLGVAVAWSAADGRVATAADVEWISALSVWGDRAAATSLTAVGPAQAPTLAATGGLATSAVAGQSSTGSGAAREPSPYDETTRWVPSLGAISGILGQNAEGDVDSRDTITFAIVSRTSRRVPGLSCPVPAPTNPICRVPNEPAPPTTSIQTRPIAALPGTGSGSNAPLPTSGGALMLTPWQLGTVEVMTPGVQQVPGRPRLFVHGDAGGTFSFLWDVAKQGVPDDLVVENPDDPAASEINVNGQGSATRAEVKTFLAGAGLGVAFTVDLAERRLRIKPSFEYMRQELALSGVVNRAYKVDSGRAPINNDVPQTQTYFPGYPSYPGVPPRFMPLTIEGNRDVTYHGIGPGLELEMDAARAGPVVLALFMQGQAYRILGDRDVEFQGSTTLDDPALTPNPQTLTANFGFHVHSWSYRGGVGLRFRWLPEPGWTER